LGSAEFWQACQNQLPTQPNNPCPRPPACLPAFLPAEFLPLPRLNALEQENFQAMQAELRDSIQKGVEFMNK
jgi:hypothetical protein